MWTDITRSQHARKELRLPSDLERLLGAEYHSARGARSSTALSLGALGVVYGDIGTSPLYALREAAKAAAGSHPISADAVIAATSAVVWSLLIIVAIKYALLIRRADVRGCCISFTIVRRDTATLVPVVRTYGQRTSAHPFADNPDRRNSCRRRRRSCRGVG